MDTSGKSAVVMPMLKVHVPEIEFVKNPRVLVLRDEHYKKWVKEHNYEELYVTSPIRSMRLNCRDMVVWDKIQWQFATNSIGRLYMTIGSNPYGTAGWPLQAQFKWSHFRVLGVRLTLIRMRHCNVPLYACVYGRGASEIDSLAVLDSTDAHPPWNGMNRPNVTLKPTPGKEDLPFVVDAMAATPDELGLLTPRDRENTYTLVVASRIMVALQPDTIYFNFVVQRRVEAWGLVL